MLMMMVMMVMTSLVLMKKKMKMSYHELELCQMDGSAQDQLRDRCAFWTHLSPRASRPLMLMMMVMTPELTLSLPASHRRCSVAFSMGEIATERPCAIAFSITRASALGRTI